MIPRPIDEISPFHPALESLVKTLNDVREVSGGHAESQ
jgi:hypothetical protein